MQIRQIHESALNPYLQAPPIAASQPVLLFSGPPEQTAAANAASAESALGREHNRAGKTLRAPPQPGYASRTVTVWTPEKYAQATAELPPRQQQRPQQQLQQPGPPGRAAAPVRPPACS